MKLASFLTPRGTASWGCLSTDGRHVHDLGAAPTRWPDMQSWLAAGDNARADLQAAIANCAMRWDAADLRWLPPVPRPDNVWCIGVNYAHRNAEYKDGSEQPKWPSVFMRTPTSLVGHGQPLRIPRESRQLDYEGEIGLVIGRAGRRIAPERALDHIAGLTCVNEGTVRDWTRHGKFNVTQGKNFDASGSVGPWLVTSDEFPDGFGNLWLRTRVNGELRQEDTTAHLMFPFAMLVSYLSTFATLQPGDLIVTGTPTGSGIRFDPPRFLQPGDLVEVEVQGVGVLANRVAEEDA